MHVLVEGRTHEGVHRDVARHVPEVPAEDGADLDVAIEDRRTQADRTDAPGFQFEDGAWSRYRQDRGIVAADEVALRLALRGRRQHADIRAGKQRIEAGDAAGEKLRLH